MSALLSYCNNSGSVDAIVARFLTHLCLSPKAAVRNAVRSDATVSTLAHLSKECNAAQPEARQLETVLAATAQGAAAGLTPELIQHWPGGRHGNDFGDFRQIGIEPAVAEVLQGPHKAYLPMADGSDQFLTDQVRPTCGSDCGDLLQPDLPPAMSRLC